MKLINEFIMVNIPAIVFLFSLFSLLPLMEARNKGYGGPSIAYRDAIRFRDMITKKAEERARILAFWKAHGDAAAKEAFGTSRHGIFATN